MPIEPAITPDPEFIKTMTKGNPQPQADSADTDGQYDQVTVKADTRHPHQDAKDRKLGDHPHSGLAKK